MILIITKNFELSNEYMPIYKRPHFDVRHMPNQQAKGRVSRDETRPFKHILENAGKLGVSYPQKLKDVLEQLKETDEQK